jgi:hypothetical protein
LLKQSISHFVIDAALIGNIVELMVIACTAPGSSSNSELR